MANPEGTTTIGIPVTASKPDREWLARVDAMIVFRGLRSRTSYFRQLASEDFRRNAGKAKS